jgi:formate C-acetyltransferase
MTTIEQARNYSIVGCVEPCASTEHFGNTDCANVNVSQPFIQALKGEKKDLWKYGVLDGLDKEAINFAKAKLLGRPYTTLKPQSETVSYNPPQNMEELMVRFEERLNNVTTAVLADHFVLETALAKNFSVPLASSLFESAVKSGKCVLEGGATINTSGIQAIAVTDVADSLLAIDELVFKKKSFTMAALLKAMDENFEGESNRKIREALLAVPKFGDDSSSETVYWMDRVLDLWVKALAACKSTRNGRYVAGYYGLNVNKAYGKNTQALPSGRLAGVPLANSLCPHYGMKSADLTSALNAISRLNFAKYAPNGTTVTSTIDSGLFPGENGINNLAGLIKGYFDQGGMQFQPNVVSREVLMDAYNNPDKYPNLIVRIAGYCAYFNDLSDELKMEIINRSYYSDDHGEA